MVQAATRTPSAVNPDTDWSQVRETVRLLELATGQVEAAMRDSGISVEVLTDTFTTLVDTLRTIDAVVGTLPDTIGNGLVRAEVQENTRIVAAKVHRAIVAFQFYDKLVQRLDHVSQSLAGLSQLLASQRHLQNPREWAALQESILANYTMTDERAMFDAVLRGVPVKEALEAYMADRMGKTAGSGGEIELF